jgi:hypothetical protein
MTQINGHGLTQPPSVAIRVVLTAQEDEMPPASFSNLTDSGFGCIIARTFAGLRARCIDFAFCYRYSCHAHVAANWKHPWQGSNADASRRAVDLALPCLLPGYPPFTPSVNHSDHTGRQGAFLPAFLLFTKLRREEVKP